MGMALERAADERLALGVGEGGDHADDPVELLVGEHDLARLADPVDLAGSSSWTRVSRRAFSARLRTIV